ncbi:MAG: NADH-quinone oxidoreductase subunit I [Methanocellales archaeon]
MVLKNLIYTLKQFFTPEVTINYPDVKYIPYPRFRARHYLNLDECVGCGVCAKVCPNKCIEMVQYKERKHPQIDLGRCMFCALCIDSCPTNALLNTTDYELAEYTREALIYPPERLGKPPKKPFYIADKEGNIVEPEEA